MGCLNSLRLVLVLLRLTTALLACPRRDDEVDHAEYEPEDGAVEASGLSSEEDEDQAKYTHRGPDDAEPPHQAVACRVVSPLESLPVVGHQRTVPSISSTVRRLQRLRLSPYADG